MSLTIDFQGTCLFSLPKDGGGIRVLVPECGNPIKYPGPAGKAVPHFTYLLIRASDVRDAGWMERVEIDGVEWAVARLGDHGDRGLGAQRISVVGRGQTARGKLHKRIARLRDQGDKSLRLVEDTDLLSAEFRFPRGNLDWVEADGSSEHAGSWRVKDSDDEDTLPWTVQWSMRHIPGQALQLEDLSSGESRYLRLAFSGRPVAIYVLNVEEDEVEKLLSRPRLTTIDDDEIVDYDFAWLYRLVERTDGDPVRPVLPTWEKIGGVPAVGASLPTCFPGGF